LIYTRLGRGGPQVSAVGLGFWEVGSRTWRGSPEVAEAIVRAAHEEGINFFDTAEVYGMGRSEEALGEAVRRLGIREHVVVASKVGGFRPTPYFILKGAEGVRRRLGFAPALLQLHWPPPAWIPLCQPLRGLERAVKAGLAEYVGLSNFSGRLLEEALYCFSSLEPVSDQVEYSLAYRTPELDVAKVARAKGIGIIAYSPLAKGALAGVTASRAVQRVDPRFKAAASDRELMDALKGVAGRLGATTAQVSLAWLISKGAVPIPGTTKPDRARELAGSADVKLSPEDVELLDRASSKFVTAWGREYGNLRSIRYVPCALQYLGLRAMGGA
jgi:aryl-alcohol dehydrogenase-like predicted oxidoreductase